MQLSSGSSGYGTAGTAGSGGKVQRQGNFRQVNDASDFRLDLVGFTGALYNERNEWIYKTKRVEIVRADEELAEKLAIAPGMEVICVERAGFFKNMPIQFSRHYLPDISFYDEIKKAGDIQFWRFLLEGKLGLHMTDAVDEVHADLAIGELDQREAHILRLHLRLTFQHLNRNEDLAAEQVHDHLFLQIP